MDALISYLVRALVDRPDQVEIRARPTDAGMLFELKVAPEDVGKVIGRDGRAIHAMRTLLTVAAQRRGETVRLEVLDDRRPPAPTAPES